MEATARRRPAIGRERTFFFWTAFAMMTSIFLGFSATWYLRPWMQRPLVIDPTEPWIAFARRGDRARRVKIGLRN